MNDIGERLESLYLECLPPDQHPQRQVHPQDEMYLWAGDLGVPPPQRRLQYMAAGREILLMLRHIVQSAGLQLSEMKAVLDFASGFGRVTRHLCYETRASHVWCSDALHDAMDWLGTEFGVHTIPSHPNPNDVDLQRKYDLIWVGSLFTHLPRKRFGPWLAKLLGALEPKGLLIFTTHADVYCPSDQRDSSGFSFVRESESRALSLDEYGTTYLTPEALRNIAREIGIQHLYSVPSEAWGRHDVQVVSHRSRKALEQLAHAPRILGAILRSEVRATGHGWVGGWAIAAPSDPLEAIELRVPGLPPTPAILGPSRAHDRGSFLHCEWYVEGPLNMLRKGQHPLLAVGRMASGREICFDGCALEIPGSLENMAAT